MILLLLLSGIAWADPTFKWMNATQIVERHEFYQNHEVIKKPKNSWQTIFGVIYRDGQMSLQKDCLFFKVPGDENGELKIKTVLLTEKCETHLFSPGDMEWKDLKAFQFAVLPERISVNLTLSGFKNERWDIPLFNIFKRPEAKIGVSSAEFRSAKMLFLSPRKEGGVSPGINSLNLADGFACHKVSDDCKEISTSVCDQCPSGWYEIPNGCDQGPKFCGNIACGKKNQPACRRGMRWQRKQAQFGCREDDSFAFCAKGLRIQCQGNLPYCI